MKNKLNTLSCRMADIEALKHENDEKLNAYYGAKKGFISSFGILAVVVISLLMVVFITFDLLPSYLSGVLSLACNAISFGLVAYALYENSPRLKTLHQTNVKTLKLNSLDYENKLKDYGNQYNEILETVILGDNI